MRTKAVRACVSGGADALQPLGWGSDWGEDRETVRARELVYPEGALPAVQSRSRGVRCDAWGARRELERNELRGTRAPCARVVRREEASARRATARVAHRDGRRSRRSSPA